MEASTFDISDSAAQRIAALIAEEPHPARTLFRVEVLGGGCAGFQYKYDLLEETPAADDLVIERHGARVAVDASSLELLKGSVLDYVEELVGAAFEMKNPNAASGCGCGNSFSVAM